MSDNAMPTLETFVERLMAEKGLAQMEAPVLAEIRQDLLERLGERLNAEMIAAIPPEKLEELNGLLEGQDNEAAVREFLMQSVPNFQDVFARTLVDFRDAYLA